MTARMGEASCHLQPQGVRTIADIARLAGVTPSTVSRSLAGKPGVRAETRRRIDEIARTHDFSINPHASNLRSGRTSGHPTRVKSLPAGGPEIDVFLAQLAEAIVDLAIRNGVGVELTIDDSGFNSEQVPQKLWLTFASARPKKAGRSEAKYCVKVSKIADDLKEGAQLRS